VKEIGAGLMGLVPIYLKIAVALQLNCRPKNALVLNL
jgi:cadmium resistance protein CadD (predicted permease)